MASPTRRSFCRMCMGHCGTVVTVDDREQLISIAGDHSDPSTLGYACFKGLQSVAAHNSPNRILHPLKRRPDGRFEAIGVEQALDEIAVRLQTILNRDGAEAIAGYKGGGAFFTSSSLMMLNDWLKAIGSPKAFSTVTIDQSAKYVTAGRMGVWPGGRDPFHRGDVFMIVGGNPLVSISTVGFDTRNPSKRLKQAKARGMKLIVIDPRRTETARMADVFLQPLPGEDPTVLAGMLHLILANDWQDHNFCQRYVGSLEPLRQAVVPFTPDYVEQRAGVPSEQLLEACRVFAQQSRRGAATSATGPDMSSHSNLAEHLVEALNVVCGRFIREGEEVPNPGALLPRWPRKAEVMPAQRWWEHGYRSRLGYGLLDNELPTGSLIDEILKPGPGQVRALLVHGGNPALAVPDQQRIVEALRSLELLVTIEPMMTATARLSDYILPPTLHYERADLPMFIYESLLFPEPFTRYTPAVAKPPANAEVRDDWYYFWGLAKRLGLQLHSWNIPLDMQNTPTTDDLLRIAAQHAPMSFEDIKQHEYGVVFDEEPQRVEPGDPDSPHRFSVAPDDITQELAEVYAEFNPSEPPRFRYRLAVRRQRDALNTACKDLPPIKQRLPFNSAYMNPDDLLAEGVGEGEMLRIESEHGVIEAMAEADVNLRPGVVSISHGFGLLPDEPEDYRSYGVSTNLLIDSRRHREPINAMPRMSGIPVNIKPASST